MSQTWDIDLINPATTSPLTDISRITDAFETLRTMHSGSSAPPDIVPYQQWVDTSTSLLKQRDAGDTAWVVRGSLAETHVETKTTNYTTVQSDRDRTILVDASGASRTVSLLAAASAGNGHRLVIKKTDSSANTVTINPDSTETIDGELTLVLDHQYDSVIIRCDGTTWHLEAQNPRIVQTVNNSITSAVTGSANIPYDDTIPQNTEGTEVLTKAIAPKSAIGFYHIQCVTNLSEDTDHSDRAICALFVDSTANALAGNVQALPAGSGRSVTMTIDHWVAIASSSAVTFKLRVGTDGVGNYTVNGDATNRKLGGVFETTMTITEVRI